jgi:CSLREA domain-containing protein
VACAAALLAAAPARAADFSVNSTVDHPPDACDAECTVRDAIAAADKTSGADTVTIPAGTYELTSALPVSDVTISGPVTDQPTATLDVAYRDRVLDVAGGAVTISHLRIVRGQSPDSTGGSALLQRGGTVTLDHDVVDGHSNNLSGGALLLQGGTLNVSDTEVTGNHAYRGGGLFVASGTANVDRTLWLENDGTTGGGGAIYNDGGTLTVANSTFAANTADSSHGGAVYAASSTTLRNVTFEANSASGNNGGGSALWSDVGVTTSSVVFGNSWYQDNCAGVPPTDLGGSVDAGTSCGLAASGATVLLGPLASNGGAARSLLPYAGSAGIDAGLDTECPNVDQRGATRAHSVDDHCDAGALEGAGGPAPPPVVTPGEAHDVTADTARVDASIDRQGLPTRYEVEYGTTTDYGQTASGDSVAFGAGPQSQTVALSGLEADTTYHYRFVATSAGGTTTGEERTFTTGPPYTGPATYAVESPRDSGTACSGSAPSFTCDSLRAAVEHANARPGPDSVILTAAETYTLSQGGLTITDDLALVGQSARTTTIQGNGDFRLVSVNAGVTASVSLVTLTNGYGGGGQGGNIRNAGNLVLTHARVTGGRADQGGGIANLAGASLVLSSSLVDHNTATLGGGGIANIGRGGAEALGAGLSVVNSTIAFNEGESGGGIESQGPSTVALNATTIAYNTGGGLGLVNEQDAALTGSLLAANSSGNCSGAARPTDGGYNLESGTGCGLTGTGSRQGADPVLSDGLVDAGGETDVLTFPRTSPAVDLVTECVVADDQRGVLREDAACDAGAYELTSSVAITAGPGPYTSSSEVRFGFASQSATEFECKLTGPGRSDDGFTGCGSPVDYTLDEEGEYTFAVHAIGSADPPTTRTFTYARATPPPSAPSAPTVTSGPPETTTATSAAFEFSATGAAGYECRLDGPAGPGTFRPCTSPATFGDLAPGAYTFTVRSVDAAGTPSAQSSPRTFSVALAPRQNPSPTPTPAPTPVPGQSVVGAPVSGKVLVKRPGGKGFVALDATQGIPLGSIVDARHGVIELTAKAGQTARFSEGIFKVTQSGGITELLLVEQLAPCGKRARAAAKKPKTRKLWGEGTGSFRTRGRYSAATVRGTKWLVQDSCAGTLTKVAKGVVSVRDEVKKRTLVLRAGKSYLARPR